MKCGFVFCSTIIMMISIILFNAINYENINATTSISTSPGDKPLKSNLNNNTSSITPSTSSANNNDNDDESKSSNNNDNDNTNSDNNNDDESKSSNNNDNDNTNSDNNNDDNPSDDTPLSLPFNSNIADQINEKEKSFDEIPFP